MIIVILSFSLAAFPQSDTTGKTVPFSDSLKTNVNKVTPVTKQSKLTLGISPEIFIPEDRSLSKNYSVGYGFNLNGSYKLSEDIDISGAVGVIASGTEFEDIFGMGDNETNSYWVSASLGPKFYTNRGTTRIYFNINLLYSNVYYQNSRIAGYVITNSSDMLGFNLGFGIEIPVYKRLNAELYPSYNCLYPLCDEQTLHQSSFYKISAGVSYNL
ncbi:MAG: hypothetical protein PHN88_06655 [Ignavibacteria bacterium]|nr:hypothetical protein [Ignavibacteria bacterium]